MLPEVPDMCLSILHPMHVSKLIVKQKNLNEADRRWNELNPSTIEQNWNLAKLRNYSSLRPFSRDRTYDCGVMFLMEIMDVSRGNILREWCCNPLQSCDKLIYCISVIVSRKIEFENNSFDLLWRWCTLKQCRNYLDWISSDRHQLHCMQINNLQ